MSRVLLQHGSVCPWLRFRRGYRQCLSRHAKQRQRVASPAIVEAATPLLQREQLEQAEVLERVIDALGVDSLASLAFHAPDDIRGLVASEPVRSAALMTVPLGSTLAIALDDNDGQLTVLSPPQLPPNVKKAIEIVAGLIRDTPDHQLLVLAVLLLWVRKHGGDAWRNYCEALLPPGRELSCLLAYSPAELPMLQLPHLTDEASRQHDWARWTHTQWTSSTSGALRRLGLADDPSETAWALAVVRSRAVEFPVGASVSAAPAAAAQGGSTAQGPSREAAARGGPVVTVLAPVIDLANHSPDPNCVVQLTTDRSRVVLLPRRHIAAGEPLTVDYGFGRSSLELMVDYGFVTPGNPHDGELSLPEAEKLPPLELSSLEAAARALVRKRQQQRLRLRKATERGGTSDAGVRAGAASASGMLAERVEEEGQQDVEEEDEEEQGEEGGNGLLALTVAGDGVAEVEEDEACFRGRLRAAVCLLSPRNGGPFTPGRGFSSPATQRIIAGLWHKLVQHTVSSLPTTLEQDLRLLYDIQAGRVSGFGGGVQLTLDPAPAPPPIPADQRQAAVAAAATAAPAGVPARVPPNRDASAATAALAGLRRGRTGKEARSLGGAAAVAPAATVPAMAAANAEGTSVLGGPQAAFPLPAPGPGPEASAAPATSGAAPGAREGSGRSKGQNSGKKRDEAMARRGPGTLGTTLEGAGQGLGELTAAVGAGAEAAAARVLCRTGRRAGRLYAAVRARIEYKELLVVAQDLLLLYGMN